MMASSLAALRGRGGGALGSDLVSVCGGRSHQPSGLLRLQDAMPANLANEVTCILVEKSIASKRGDEHVCCRRRRRF
jgi:hypothetical protein